MASLRAATRDAMVSALAAVLAWCDDADTRPWPEVRTQIESALAMVAADSSPSGDEPAFAGSHYNPAVDDQRLTLQIGRVFEAMCDGGWHTIADLAAAINDPPSSISAQLRHLRKPRHGSWMIDLEPSGNRSAGLFVYRMRNPDGTELPPVVPGSLQQFVAAAPVNDGDEED